MNTTRAHAAVVFRLLVGMARPGTIEKRLPVRTNRPRVAMSGRYGRPSGPMTSSIIEVNCSSTTSRKFWTPCGTSATRRDARRANAVRMIMASHV
jgi:hypothetical protein